MIPTLFVSEARITSVKTTEIPFNLNHFPCWNSIIIKNKAYKSKLASIITLNWGFPISFPAASVF